MIREDLKPIVDKLVKEWFRRSRYLLQEYLQVNSKDSGRSIFPWNKYKVIVRSDDHWPPHFHIITKSKWSASFRIDNGAMFNPKKQNYDEISAKKKKKNVPTWLAQPSASDPSQTNQQIIAATWNGYHPSMTINEEELQFSNP